MSGTDRPLDSGRKDSLGRTIRVSDQAGESRADAPAPPDRASSDVDDDTIGVIVDDLATELRSDGLDPTTPFVDLHDVCDPNQYVADVIEERLGDMPWNKLLDLANRVTDEYERRRTAPLPDNLGDVLQEVTDYEWRCSCCGEWVPSGEPCPHNTTEAMFDEIGRSMLERRDPNVAWAEAGVTDPTIITRLVDRGHSPADFTSDDRDVRMSACAARGDLVFEDRLLSHAFDINQHSQHPSLTHRRAIVPRGIYMSDDPADRARSEAAYIDGYAAGLNQIAELRDRLGGEWVNAAIADRGWQFPGVAAPESGSHEAKVRRAGFLHAYQVEAMRDQMEAGEIPAELTIRTSMSVSGTARLRSIRRLQHGNWSGVLNSNEQRWNNDGETIPRAVGTSEWFTIDQIEPSSAGWQGQ